MMPTPGQKAKLKQILKDSKSAADRLEELDSLKSNLNRMKSIRLYDGQGSKIGFIDDKSGSVIDDLKASIESFLDSEIDALFTDAETTRKEANS